MCLCDHFQIWVIWDAIFTAFVPVFLLVCSLHLGVFGFDSILLTGISKGLNDLHLHLPGAQGDFD